MRITCALLYRAELEGQKVN